MKNVMEFTATLELSAPKDVSKMYNFVSIRGFTKNMKTEWSIFWSSKIYPKHINFATVVFSQHVPTTLLGTQFFLLTFLNCVEEKNFVGGKWKVEKSYVSSIVLVCSKCRVSKFSFILFRENFVQATKKWTKIFVHFREHFR